MFKIIFFVVACFLFYVFENDVISARAFTPASQVTKKQIFRHFVTMVLFNIVRTGTTIIMVNFVIDVLSFLLALAAFVLLVRDFYVYRQFGKAKKQRSNRRRRRR